MTIGYIWPDGDHLAGACNLCPPPEGVKRWPLRGLGLVEAVRFLACHRDPFADPSEVPS